MIGAFYAAIKEASSKGRKERKRRACSVVRFVCFLFSFFSCVVPSSRSFFSVYLSIYLPRYLTSATLQSCRRTSSFLLSLGALWCGRVEENGWRAMVFSQTLRVCCKYVCLYECMYDALISFGECKQKLSRVPERDSSFMDCQEKDKQSFLRPAIPAGTWSPCMLADFHSLDGKTGSGLMN